MLDKDKIITTSVSEAVEKILQMKKIIANAPLCVLLCIATAFKEQTNIYLTVVEIPVCLLGYIQCT